MFFIMTLTNIVGNLIPHFLMTSNNISITNSINNTSSSFALHPYHIVALSPWPILISISVFGILASTALWFNNLNGSGIALILGVISVLVIIINWFGDITGESSLIGLHTKIVAKAHVIGIGLFITTEFIFFFSIFWAFFHTSLSPTVELGSSWPPLGIEAVNPFIIPLLNTALLISSGATVTYAHHNFFIGDRKGAIIGIILTLILAIVFTILQGFEYSVSEFTISDGAFGSCFYFSTGFHGFHVILGTIIIIVAFIRLVVYSITKEHHVGAESAILYWH